jgi:hypothetical protein
MRLVKRYAVFVLALFYACSSDDGVPKNVMVPEKMKQVLFDVIRVQEYASLKYGHDSAVIDANMPVLMQQVFTIHKITKDDFFTSFDYYQNHPDKNQTLFDSLSTYTDQQRQELFKKLR